MRRYIVYVFTKTTGSELYTKRVHYFVRRSDAKQFAREIKHELCKETLDPCSNIRDFIVFD